MQLQIHSLHFKFEVVFVQKRGIPGSLLNSSVCVGGLFFDS